eukprot:TRINITY_DN5594_c0_g1_i1.p2 TRINITY_DN5594_c0_g1~~TRINITY_DN5594_c0_g1_i1.p2  ORF type:complete len:112 (-),score=22.64 TRINITY_DN5594_c0_g1_i1:15-350(-)
MATNATTLIPNIVKVTLVKSRYHARPAVEKTLAALNLKHIHGYVYHKNSPTIRGMIHRVKHYVSIEEIPFPKIPKTPILKTTKTSKTPSTKDTIVQNTETTSTTTTTSPSS